ncbi:hypothetical protein V8G54_018010 [Vigna mungo]|uniref:Uncharacterized protein n=1 Tax=Vigna mungo TaxID=3915 RepID=A0AAQ3N7R7_VIGMU
MDGVGSRIARVEIIRGSHNSSLLGTVKAISVVTHASNASILSEVTSNGSLKRVMIASCKRDSSTMSSTKGLNNVLHINLHSIHSTRSQVSMELIIEVENLLWVHQA